MRFADLDAVTVDGMGTLIELVDPVYALGEALSSHGVERGSPEIAAAFAAEVAYYRPRSHTAGDTTRLAGLRRECVAVFLAELGADVEAEAFVEGFLDALVFRPAAGAVSALKRLRSEGLRVAVVSNWDCSLPEALSATGLSGLVDAVVASADVGVPKPGAAPFRRALEVIAAEPGRALHIGDECDDEAGARAAGMHFAPAPLARAVQGLA